MTVGILNENNVTQHCLIVSCTMDFTSQREKCLGVQLGLMVSASQIYTPTTQPCTMTPWQSMNHYIGCTQSIQEPVDNSSLMILLASLQMGAVELGG